MVRCLVGLLRRKVVVGYGYGYGCGYWIVWFRLIGGRRVGRRD